MFQIIIYFDFFKDKMLNLIFIFYFKKYFYIEKNSILSQIFLIFK